MNRLAKSLQFKCQLMTESNLDKRLLNRNVYDTLILDLKDVNPVKRNMKYEYTGEYEQRGIL